MVQRHILLGSKGSSLVRESWRSPSFVVES